MGVETMMRVMSAMLLARVLGMIAALGVVATVLVALGPAAPARAVTGAEFRPGNIISDALFYDGQAMTQSEIQSFLDQRIGSCLNGRCLNVLVAPLESRERAVSSTTGNLICEAVEGGVLSVAAIIYRVQVACGISAKVILVTLQKEQGLILSRAPTEGALARAMGMACPDTAPCAEYALGLSNQIYLGTRQLKTYKAANFARQPGLQAVQFHPNAGCGSSPVLVENYATAALYNYTPYQPNAAALSNLGGLGDSCSSYGNRNFWVFHNAWFGTTQGIPASSPNVAARILALRDDGTLLAYPTNGRGTWLPPVVMATGLAPATRIIGAGDIDGDGTRDVLTLDTAGSLVRYSIDAVGALNTAVTVAGGWSSANLVLSPGDFNGDGSVDLLSRDVAGDLWLHANNGRGVFAPGVRVGNGWGGFDTIVGAGDFSGDGLADVIARVPDGRLFLYLGNGRGSWLGARTIGWGWNGLTGIAIPGDVNGDGTVDVVARTATGALIVYPGDGRGSWRAAYQLGPGWNAMVALAGPGAPALRPFTEQPGAGDLTGDGARDVLALDAAGRLVVYAGNGRGSWLGSSVLASGFAAGTRVFGAGDLNNDGLPEVVTIDPVGVMSVHAGDRRGGLGAGVALGSGWDQLPLVFFGGDVNGDRRGDLIGRDTGGLLWLYPGDGAGGFGARVQMGNGWLSKTAVFSPGDFNGDSRPDVISRTSGGDLLLYAGDGRGGLQGPVTIGNGWQSFTNVFGPGDFDGDGNADVMARNSAGQLFLYGGNGSGGWKTARVIGWGWGSFSIVQ